LLKAFFPEGFLFLLIAITRIDGYRDTFVRQFLTRTHTDRLIADSGYGYIEQCIGDGAIPDREGAISGKFLHKLIGKLLADVSLGKIRVIGDQGNGDALDPGWKTCSREGITAGKLNEDCRDKKEG
jgi:hypothetical protein